MRGAAREVVQGSLGMGRMDGCAGRAQDAKTVLELRLAAADRRAGVDLAGDAVAQPIILLLVVLARLAGRFAGSCVCVSLAPACNLDRGTPV
jgi:hypothetical protein